MKKNNILIFVTMLISIYLSTNLVAQNHSSVDLDVKNKSDEQIIEILHKLVPKLHPAELEVAKLIQAEYETAKYNKEKIWDKTYSKLFKALYTSYRKLDDHKYIILNTESELKKVESELSGLEDKIITTKNQIKKLENNKENIINKVKNDIANIPLEVVVTGIATYPSYIIERDASDASIKTAKKKAIEYINGVFIQSQSFMTGEILIEDIIRATTGGKVEVRQSLQQNYTRTSSDAKHEIVHTIQLYAIYPLIKEPDDQICKNNPSIETNSIVIDENNMVSLDDYPDDIARQGKNMVITAQSFNRNQKEQISAIISDAQASLLKLDRNIHDIQQEVKFYTSQKTEINDRLIRIKNELAELQTQLKPVEINFNNANTVLQDYLSDKELIHIDFKSAEKDPMKSRDAQYEELISQCILGFRDKIKTSYIQTLDEIRNHMLVNQRNLKKDVNAEIQSVKILYLSFKQIGIRPSYGVALKFSAKLTAPQIVFGDYKPLFSFNKINKTIYDIVFVLDTNAEIEGSISYNEDLPKFIDYLSKYIQDNQNLTVNIGIVAFRDYIKNQPANEYVTKLIMNITSNYDELKAEINKLTFPNVSSEDWAQAVFDGLMSAIEEIHWSSTSKRAIILISGGAPHPSGDDKNPMNYSPEGIKKAAKARGIDIHTIAVARKKNQFFENSSAQINTLSTGSEIQIYKEESDTMKSRLKLTLAKSEYARKDLEKLYNKSDSKEKLKQLESELRDIHRKMVCLRIRIEELNLDNIIFNIIVNWIANSDAK